MDSVSEKRTQHLQTLKKQQIQVEETLQTLWKKQYEQEWQEADYDVMRTEQRALQELLHNGWQGDNAQAFHYYIEDVQEQEQRTWKKDIQTEADILKKEVSESKRKFIQLEEQQAQIRKELTS